ncbi:MAG TPA: hypothetical protein HA261_00995 [Methanosarcina sp.]|nr:hypothetical protein [Methanosarcina sp.]
MEKPYKIKILLFLFLILNFSCAGELGVSPGTNSSKNIENINQGSILLFAGNYSENYGVPENIFVAKIQNGTSDILYSTIYGTHESKITFDNFSAGLKYTTTRDCSPVSYFILPVVDPITNFGTDKYVEYFRGSSKTYSFCKCASIPLIHYIEQSKQIGSLYICGFTPMAKCTYQISMDINADDPQSFVELNSPGSRLIISEIGNKSVLNSYYKTPSGELKYESICLGNVGERHDFEIMFDGYNKTNTIAVSNDTRIVTPFYDLERQKLPYVDFSNGYIKFTSFVIRKGTYIDVNIYNIDQYADRNFITAIGNNSILAFGLDGPHPMNSTEQGINYLISKGDKGTIWFDVGLLKKCNETELEYLRSLVKNDSWDTGIHYSKELTSLPLEEAYRVMDEEYSYVYETIGEKPTNWCSLRNSDNITHAIYAYDNLGMVWRNGNSGVHAEQSVGNLDDDTWIWWEAASSAGMAYPVFTHQTDKDPSIKYSISYSKFQTWADNYDSNNVSIVSFYEYYKVNSNTYDAFFDSIEYGEDYLTFKANTNGASALINVNINAGNNTQVYDNTLEKFLGYRVEGDGSITFQVENNHTYNIYPEGTKQ